MIVLNCPHCKKPASYEETEPATLNCSLCGESFISMGRLPKPDWSIDMGPRDYDGPLKIVNLPKRACGYCGRVCKKNEYACGRCLCDLNQVATVNLKRWMMDLDVDPDPNVVWAYLALAELDISENEALLRLLRLQPRTAREMGASVALAERMNPLETPPRSEAAERVLAEERVEEFEADDSWREEAMTASLNGRIAYLFTLGFLFYVVTAAVGLGLVAVGIGLLVYGRWALLKLVIVALSVGGGLLWAILPRFDRFRAPGPELTDADHPKLFAAIREIAAKTGQSEPDHVYAVPEVNAFVATRGGLLGFGGKKIMGLGWPLMQALTVSEFKAVLAHEFGHFHGGDTKQAPLIYRIREAIGRLKMRFQEEETHSWFNKPFNWFADHFLAQSQLVSRRQEYNADALAAQIQGPTALINGLRKMMGVSKAFHHYYQDEIAPILRMGMRVPIAEGFSGFLESESTQQQMAKDTDFSQFETDAHPYDSHPPTGYRIKNVARFDEPATPPETDSAVTLLGDLALLEQATLAFYFEEEGTRDYPLIAWDQVAERFYLPYWQEYLHHFAARFNDVCLGDLPELYRDPHALLSTWEANLDDMTQEEMADLLVFPFRCALGLALAGQGWALRAVPGEPLTAGKDGRTIDLHDLATGVRQNGDDALWAELVAGTDLAKIKVNDLGAPEKLENKRKHMQLHTKKPTGRALLRFEDLSKTAYAALLFWTLAGGFWFMDPAMGWWLIGGCIIIPFALAVSLPARRFLRARHGIGHWVIDDETVMFTANNRTTRIRFSEIQQLHMRRVDLDMNEAGVSTWWSFDIKAATARIRVNHYRDAGRHGALVEEMAERLGEWRAARWAKDIENGGRIVGEGWQVTRDGLQPAGQTNAIPWDELATPNWVNHKVVFHRRGQVEPVFTTPHDGPDSLTLMRLGELLAKCEGPTSAFGKFQGIGPCRGGWGFRILVGSAMACVLLGMFLFGAVLKNEAAAFHVPLGTLSLAAGVALAFAAYRARRARKVDVYENGLRLKGFFGPKALCYDDLISTRFTHNESDDDDDDGCVTVWLRSVDQQLTLVIDEVQKNFIDSLVHGSAMAVARNVYPQLVGGAPWHWTGGLWISEDGLTHGEDKRFHIPLQHLVFETEGGDPLVLHAEHSGVFARYDPQSVNGLVGIYLVQRLQEAAQKAAQAETPVCRVS